MSRIVRSLCSMPSFGVLGSSPTFIGGVSGAIVPTTTDFDTLGGRATVPDGHTITDPTDLAAGWAFTTGLVVWFDGFAALYELPLHASSSSLSMSFWYNPYDEAFESLSGGNDNPVGTVFSNSGLAEKIAPNTRYEPSYFGMKYTSNPPDNTPQPLVSLTIPGSHNGDPGVQDSVSADTFGLTVPGFTTDPGDEMQGWCHVMVGMHAVAGKCKLTIYVNDTAILTDQILPDNLGAPAAGETWIIPFADPSFTDPNADYGSAGAFVGPWTIGGVFDSSNILSTLPNATGNGLVGAMTEVWIAPGQYIDWSVEANRNKFHNKDLTETLYAPTNLGSRGATPTGTRPQYYFTGDPTKFPLNRGVGGAAVSVWHRDAPFGFVDVLRDYGKVPGT